MSDFHAGPRFSCAHIYRRGLQQFLFGGGAALRLPTPDGTEN